MRILLYSISYSPEIAGSGRYNGELAEWLANKGHRVDIITAHPYYPEWKVWAGYRSRYWFQEKKHNLTVYRTPLYVPRQVSGKSRIIHELSFVLSSLIHWIPLSFIKYDLLIAVCPPFHIGFLPYLISRIKSIPYLFHVQDLQVDAARELGLIKNKIILDVLGKLENFLLDKASVVSSISEGMKRNILRKGVKEGNYFMLPNWVDVNLIKPLPVEFSLRKKFGFTSTDKIALYSGNIGEKQGLEILPEVAYLLREETNIKLVIFGEGAARARLQVLIEQNNITNLYLFDPVANFEDFPKVLAMADVHLVIQKRAASDLVMPSKLVTILSAGGASIVSADKDTSLNDIIVENQLGWVVDPENAFLLAETIKCALASDRLPVLRHNARQYAERYLDKESILSRYENFLKSLI